MKMLFVAAVLAVGATALAPRTSHALLIDFSTGTTGNLSSPSFTDSGVTARGGYQEFPEPPEPVYGVPRAVGPWWGSKGATPL